MIIVEELMNKIVNNRKWLLLMTIIKIKTIVKSSTNLVGEGVWSDNNSSSYFAVGTYGGGDNVSN